MRFLMPGEAHRLGYLLERIFAKPWNLVPAFTVSTLSAGGCKSARRREFSRFPGPPESRSPAMRFAPSSTKGEAPAQKNVGDPSRRPESLSVGHPASGQECGAGRKVELQRPTFDPFYPGFRGLPIQISFVPNEILEMSFQQIRCHTESGPGHPLPQFHPAAAFRTTTPAGGEPKAKPKPTASVADNDLAIGRCRGNGRYRTALYWDRYRRFFILEGRCSERPGPRRLAPQHRAWSSADSLLWWATTKGAGAVVVDHSFYTTINMVRTIESLLGVARQ